MSAPALCASLGRQQIASSPWAAQTDQRARPLAQGRRCAPRAGGGAVGASVGLAQRSCTPCEPDRGSLSFMGLCQALDRRTAEQYLQQLPGWQLEEDGCGRLHLKRTWVVKNFVKGLALCGKIAEVAESEGHHPDLHLTDWNRLTVSLWTHARNGLTENDFILAAKLDAISKEGLLRGQQKRFADI